ncbi:hypothetical protein K3495_g8932 [Podosphaera aphanis]|nr:hypothetical protein K3495_g8932 [Podosphaera aphanis]
MGTLSSLQFQFSSPGSKKRIDDVAASSLSHLQARIGSISMEDRPLDLSKKNTLLRCFSEKYPTTVKTIRIVAADFTFAQIVEKLRRAEFEEKDKPDETALRAEGNPSSDKKKKFESVTTAENLGISSLTAKRSEMKGASSKQDKTPARRSQEWHG